MGGALYVCAFGAAYLIYGVFEEKAKGTFFGQHAFIHMVDAPMFALLALGAVGVFLRQKDRLGKLGKAGFSLTFVGYGLSVVGGLTIVVVGLAMSDEAALGLLDVLTHPAAHVLLYAVGSLLFGIATYRAGVLPRGGALPMAVGPIWLFASFMAGLGQTVLPIVVPVASPRWAGCGSATRSSPRRGRHPRSPRPPSAEGIGKRPPRGKEILVNNQTLGTIAIICAPALLVEVLLVRAGRAPRSRASRA